MGEMASIIPRFHHEQIDGKSYAFRLRFVTHLISQSISISESFDDLDRGESISYIYHQNHSNDANQR